MSPCRQKGRDGSVLGVFTVELLLFLRFRRVALHWRTAERNSSSNLSTLMRARVRPYPAMTYRSQARCLAAICKIAVSLPLVMRPPFCFQESGLGSYQVGKVLTSG